MKFQEDYLYHIYNQANGDLTLFRKDADYNVFLEKMERWITPVCDIIAFCVMPNHFHLMVHANSTSVCEQKLGLLTINELSNGLRILQSQYAQYYNDEYGSRGSVFRPKAKSKCLNNGSENYARSCLIYILQNPVKARLCADIYAWEFSSAKAFLDNREAPLISKELLEKHIDLSPEDLSEVGQKINWDDRDIWTL